MRCRRLRNSPAWVRKKEADKRAEKKLEVLKGATRISNEVVASIINGPKTGRIYRKSKGVTHQASAPGEPPAADTGRLAGSNDVRGFPGQLMAEASERTEYAAKLEFGDSKVEARPHMRRAAKKHRKAIAKAIGDAADKAS